MYDFYSSSYSSVLFVSSDAKFSCSGPLGCNRFYVIIFNRPSHKEDSCDQWATKSAVQEFCWKILSCSAAFSTHRRAHHIIFIFSQVLASKSIWLLESLSFAFIRPDFETTQPLCSRYQSLTVFFRAHSSEVFAQWVWSRAEQWTPVHDKRWSEKPELYGKGVHITQNSHISGFNRSWLAENDIGIFTSLLLGYRSLTVQVLWLHNSQTMISPVGSNDLTRKISQGGRVCFVSIIIGPSFRIVLPPDQKIILHLAYSRYSSGHLPVPLFCDQKSDTSSR